MPIHTYDTVEQAVQSARRLFQAGADAVKLEGGRMKQKSVTFCGGKMPRDFMILGKYMICANQGSSTVTVFKVEKEKLTYVNQEEEVFIPEVLCVC